VVHHAGKELSQRRQRGNAGADEVIATLREQNKKMQGGNGGRGSKKPSGRNEGKLLISDHYPTVDVKIEAGGRGSVQGDCKTPRDLSKHMVTGESPYHVTWKGGIGEKKRGRI